MALGTRWFVCGLCRGVKLAKRDNGIFYEQTLDHLR
jgi:hypothetical protein